MWFFFRNKFLAEHRKSHLDAVGNLPCPKCEKSWPNVTEMSKHIHNMGPTAYIWTPIMDKVQVFGHFCVISATFVSSVHSDAFCKFPLRWIYYCHSSKSNRKETGKTHLCAVLQNRRQTLRSYCPNIYILLPYLCTTIRSRYLYVILLHSLDTNDTLLSLCNI